MTDTPADPARRAVAAPRTDTEAGPERPSRVEFVALMATLMAMIAFSIDAMLPALPQIADELSPDAPNLAQLVVACLVLGIGVGTLFTGPLSDALGRKPVLIGSAVLYCGGATLAWAAPTIETLLAARVIQGLGAAGPRVTVMAIIRDRFAGREMAQMMSFVIMIFTLVPAFAPSIGAGIIVLAGWRALFLSFVALAVIATLWLALRQPETLPPARRNALRLRPVLVAAAEVVRHPMVRAATLVQALAFGMLFANVSTTQLIFDQTFDEGARFPMWFALMALVGASGGALNAKLVMGYGMRRIIVTTLVAQCGLSAAFLAVALSGAVPGPVYFAAYMVWSACVFATAGLTIGNIGAIALEPMGHIAGTAASVVTAFGTAGAALIAGPLGLTFNGTPVPVTMGVLGCAAVGLVLMLRMPGEPRDIAT